MRKLNLFTGLLLAILGLPCLSSYAIEYIPTPVGEDYSQLAMHKCRILPEPQVEADPAETETDNPSAAPVASVPITIAADPVAAPVVAAPVTSVPTAACDSACAAVGNPNCGLTEADNQCQAGWLNGGCLQRCKINQVLNAIQWSGYAEAGIMCNTYGNPVNGYPNSGSFNGGGLNALYLSALKEAKTNGCGIDWGFGADFMFGEDARIMRSNTGLDQSWVTGHDRFGNGTYGFAMPQLYMDIAVNDWTVRLGHFYTFLGYEGAKATDRFFYTRGLSFDGLPVTHTGAIVTYNGFENLTVSLGWVNGINNGFDTNFGESLIVGKFVYKFNPAVKISYGFGAGNIAYESIAPGTGCIHAADLEIELSERLTSVSTFDYGDYNDSLSTKKTTDLTFGQHLYYTLNDSWKLGTRIEWNRTVFPTQDFLERFSLSVGANWKPFNTDSFMIRPELRYDSATKLNGVGMFNDGRNPDQILLGFDLLYNF